MGTAAHVPAMPDVVKQPTANLVALCPSTGSRDRESALELLWLAV